MSNDLQQKIRSHSYSPHPRVEDYLIDQRRRQSIPEAIDITVRERRLSGLSMTGSEPMEEQVDGHERCITPARVDRPDLTCVICFSLAINPFRCAKVEERAVMGIDVSQTYDQVFHLCCYQCLTGWMLRHNVQEFRCPVCRVNEFYLANLKCPDNKTITDSESYIIDCRYNCGLMGSPVALANHMCPLQVRAANVPM